MARPPRRPKHPVIVSSKVASLRPRYTLPAIAGSVSEAVFSPDGSLIALAMGADVRIHYAANGAFAGQFNVGWQQALSLAFHPGGRHLAVGGHNGSSLTIWDVKSYTLVQRITMQLPGTLNWFQPASLAFSKSGATLMAQGQDQRLVMWHWNGAHPVLRQILTWPGTFNGALRASPDGYWLAAVRGTGRVGIYRYNLDAELEQQPGTRDTGQPVASLCFDGASRHLVYAGGPDTTGFAEMIRLEDGQVIGRFGKTAAEHGGQVLGAALSLAAPLLALSQGSSLQVSGQVHFYDIDSGTLLRSIDQTTSAMAFSPDGRRLLIASSAGSGGTSTVQLWTV